DARTRLHALWTIDGLAEAPADLIDRALQDMDPAMRAAAVRLMEPCLRGGDGAALAKLLPLAGDASIEVRWQVAASLGELPQDHRIEPLLRLLQGAGDDPVMVDAIVSGLAGLERTMLDALLASPGTENLEDPV